MENTAPSSPRLTGMITPPRLSTCVQTGTPMKPSLDTAAADLLSEHDRLGVSLTLLKESALCVEEFFASASKDPIPDLGKTIADLQSAKTEKAMYQPICDLLNKISKTIFLGTKSGIKPLIFRPFANKPHESWGSTEYNTKPDFGCFEGEVLDLDKPAIEMPNPPAWPFSDGVGEGKINWTEGDIPQVVDYVQSNLEQRPDKESALSIHATKSGYVLVRVNSVRLCRTKPLKWANLSPLFSYVRELYSAPRDESMTRKSNCWQVDFEGARYDAFPIYSTKPIGRRSWIAIAEDPNDRGRLVIIKDIWRDEGRSHFEGELLQAIHTPKAVPGVVQCLASGVVEGSPMQTCSSSERTVKRKKYRVILGQVGFPLSSCKSTHEFLKVCLDAVQVHRECLRKGVLHRDLGWNNLLVCPRREFHGVRWGSSVEEMRFVDTVIDNDGETGPRCILTDFDNASTWGPPPAASSRKDERKNQPQRTGTPMFIAVDFALKQMNPDVYEAHTGHTFKKGIYVASPRAKKYAEKYNLGDNCKFQDHLKVVAEWAAKLDDDERGNLSDPILHAPYHDMESLFWCITWHCARARPPPQTKSSTGADSGDAACEDDLSSYAIFCEAMLTHKVGQALDSRANYKKYRPSVWEEILHPSLQNQGLGTMLSAMGRYLYLPWQLFPGGAYPEHGHDMMTIMLLNAIAGLDKPIDLYRLPRPLPVLTRTKVGVRTSIIADTSLIKLSESLDWLTLAPHQEDQSTPSLPKPEPRRSGRKRAPASVVQASVDKWHQLLVTNKRWFK